MTDGVEATFSPQAKARMLAKQAAKLAKEGRRAESEKVFRRAFGEVREVRGPLGNTKNDVAARSQLATILADEAVGAGLSATFAMEMWRMGCNADMLDAEERGSTHMFYPVEIMDIARREKAGGPEEDAAPAVTCEIEKERKSFPLPWPIRFVVSNFRNLFFGEGESGKREGAGENE